MRWVWKDSAPWSIGSLGRWLLRVHSEWLKYFGCAIYNFNDVVKIEYSAIYSQYFIVPIKKIKNDQKKPEFSSDQNPGCLGYVGDYTTQLNRDCIL